MFIGYSPTFMSVMRNPSQTFSQADRYGPPKSAKSLRLRGVCREQYYTSRPKKYITKAGIFQPAKKNKIYLFY